MNILRRFLEHLVAPACGIDLIAEERQRQLAVENFNDAHDDRYRDGELARAAACYASPFWAYGLDEHGRPYDLWPSSLGLQWDKRLNQRGLFVMTPRTALARKLRIHELAKAGALIAAEIDRLQRTAEGSCR